MSKSATVFVNYLTSWYVLSSPTTTPILIHNHSAAETAARSGKKTVMPADVFAAMHDLEFAFMLPRLEAEVTKFTSIQADKRNTYRKKVREEKKAQKEGPQDDVVAGAEEGGEERASKRARMDGEAGASEEDGAEEGDETVDVEDEEVEDDEIEEDEEEKEGEGLAEDALEEREEKDEDDEMGDGDESD